MDKPISIAIEELRQNIINSINTSNLPPSVVEMIVKDVYVEVNNLKSQEYNKAVEKYNSIEVDNVESD